MRSSEITSASFDRSPPTGDGQAELRDEPVGERSGVEAGELDRGFRTLRLDAGAGDEAWEDFAGEIRRELIQYTLRLKRHIEGI